MGNDSNCHVSNTEALSNCSSEETRRHRGRLGGRWDGRWVRLGPHIFVEMRLLVCEWPGRLRFVAVNNINRDLRDKGTSPEVLSQNVGKILVQFASYVFSPLVNVRWSCQARNGATWPRGLGFWGLPSREGPWCSVCFSDRVWPAVRGPPSRGRWTYRGLISSLDLP